MTDASIGEANPTNQQSAARDETISVGKVTKSVKVFSQEGLILSAAESFSPSAGEREQGRILVTSD